MITAIDGTPAVRAQLSGTEVYARHVIEALAAGKEARIMRVYANAADRPAWLAADVDWRGIPFPRVWTHWRLRRALHRDPPDVVFVPSHVLPLGLRIPAVVTIHECRPSPRTRCLPPDHLVVPGVDDPVHGASRQTPDRRLPVDSG